MYQLNMQILTCTQIDEKQIKSVLDCFIIIPVWLL